MGNAVLNTNLSVDAIISGRELTWVESPILGIQRGLLERNGGDTRGRVTSLVRFAPNSRFPSHSHPAGEEFLVLSGVFSDSQGHYRAGTYVRNPPGSSHAPFSQSGCTLFVKLAQFRQEDILAVVIDSHESVLWRKESQGLMTLALFEDRYEQVELLKLKADTRQQIESIEDSLLYRKTGHLSSR